MTSSLDKPHCVECSKSADLYCKGCHAASYCSGACQRRHWIQHQNLCVSIGQLQREKMHVTENDIRATVNNVSPSLKSHIVKIIGERCLVTCKLNNKTMALLWDTGAQVSLVNRSWLKSNFPEAQILPQAS